MLNQTKGQVNQAKGQLAQAQAQVELAGINVRRDTPLAEAQAIAHSILDNDIKTQQANQAAVAGAQAAIEGAQQAVEAAELNVGFTKVRSLIARKLRAAAPARHGCAITAAIRATWEC